MKNSKKAVLACAVALCAASAGATEGGNSAYVIGAQTIFPGTLDPGMQFQSFTVIYNSGNFKDSNGNNKFKQFSSNVQVQAFRFQYVLPEEFHGFRFGMAALLPFFHINTYRQPPGGAMIHGNDTGLSDPLITPVMIGNSFNAPFLGHVNQAVRLTVNVPIGNYASSQPFNVGHHYWAFLPSYGIDVHPDDKTTIGMNFTYIWNGRNLNDGYRSGQETVTEFVAMRKVTPKLSLGLNGYYYKQISGDVQKNGTPFNGDGFYGRAVAIGPQIQYQFTKKTAVTVKWQHEMLVQNRPQGERIWMQWSFKL
ncbi:hypothetical protein GXB81_06330 [Paraburkholderia sp. Ac-20336]|uniref:SphA family protein n=1 Tax=Paraburkholderia sp. Ac-20336 TaxID=2703886 RepID=UPI00197EE98B|nr:transporter [Paraburkholderia sp. Ac-20336]MBN3802673.1 hypothetical protein [Paraburkholderia sp. Ac-20336]